MTALTVIVCGTPASAPSWWRPDMEMGPLEAAWIESISAGQEAQLRELLAGEDRRDRLLSGPCDLCQETADEPLVEVAGEALCRGCLGVAYDEAVEQVRAPGERDPPESVEQWESGC